MSRSRSISPLRPNALQALRPFAHPTDRSFRPSRERTTDDAILGFAIPSSDSDRPGPYGPTTISRLLRAGRLPNQTRRSLFVVCESLPPDAEPDHPSPHRRQLQSLSTPKLSPLRPETADLARRASATRSIPTITAAELSKNAGSDSAPSPDLGLVNISSFGTRTRGSAKISGRRS